MLSAPPPPFSLFSLKPSPLREVQVAYRRLCLLRVSGKTAEAETLETEKLPAVIAKVRESLAVTDEQLEAIFAREDDRVDNAHALAEILLPLLTAANDAAPFRRNSTAPVPRDAGTFSPEPLPPTEPAGNTGPLLPGIADFIDEMLTLDRASAGSRNSRHSS